MAMHDDELEIGVDLVRRLIDEQFPQWSALPVRAAATAGTVNAIFRMGDLLAARFPLRAADPNTVRDWLTREADAAAEFAKISHIPGPEPVALGEPGDGYRLPWAVQTW
ncbi:MAG: aminoglycoside phosphotransferase, partial [Sciscionella sp.]